MDHRNGASARTTFSIVAGLGKDQPLLHFIACHNQIKELGHTKLRNESFAASNKRCPEQTVMEGEL
jgi:hypothetical protein